MDESSRSRVLDQLDTNSISFLSASPSTTGSQVNLNDSLLKFSCMKTVNSPISKNDENTPVKWQFERKEFQFQSNSTPSKRKAETVQQKFPQGRKRRSLIMGARPKVSSRLNNSTSKLDLIDESKLTSLPIPHPASDSILFELGSIRTENKRTRETDEDKIDGNLTNGMIHDINMDFDKSIITHNSMKEQRHPIVLVEDYIPQDDSAIYHSNKRKISLSDLKTKINKRNDGHVPLKLRKLKNSGISHLAKPKLSLATHTIETSFEYSTVDFEEADSRLHIGNQANKESNSPYLNCILGDIIKPHTPSDKDRYLSGISEENLLIRCVVCEEPLYEISSLLPDNNKFKEIVCGACASKYEAAIKAFEEYEFETSFESSNFSMASDMNSFISYENEGRLINNRNINSTRLEILHDDKFSDELIKSLQVILETSDNKVISKEKNVLDSSTMMWFIEARKKIRWRWRVSGLLPQFLSKNNQLPPEE
ncbi:hypothetical protein Kpol_1036p11 [Vanderwaltozyma polyspora DSM 70294]|uniref:Uncharacterized protein n=1 Tax=Vanderwaltozyma polyspora (strain ATCC 22028 / DSM 70294 / BCRC 21397 / CBS 2163 / NBRC 10782 / NRRL Y-8283 / UCD 57-17) TaxID=436907 RepID=A7TEG2_VANPO|nr:uncharacterized protein Kpol_1036p11 [Vanderwaltozyma polyspora DSM 70294]EDO19269.1 hypothetical protein Kpol_1036p11 [Vanderwaltozyma polyspora DSM 70294]